MIHHPFGIFDNSAKDYQHIKAEPLAAAMGAEILGVNLADVSDEAFQEIQHALFRHKMIYFRDQDISHAEHEAFSAKFGEFADDAYTDGVTDHSNVQPVLREADDPVAIIFGSGWHSDSPFLPKPPAISMLRGIDIPPYGGDTMWANAALAYDQLSDTMKSVLSPLKVHMSIQNFLNEMKKTGADGSPVTLKSSVQQSSNPEAAKQKFVGSYHPIIRTHPVTGEKALYCDKSYTTNIQGMSSEEARPILDYLVNHMTQAAFTCRLRWKPNTFALWDNRLCIHQAFNDHDGFRREMYRTIIAGEAPA
ncbi:MAG: TauD/TfdA family dioxygenase [Pseudomonadales bacterium]|nr:TauD/TfdA family dioxygenase [Pseudomonadales bacterium]